MTDRIVLTPIGVVRGGRTRIFEDHWGPVVSRLVLDHTVVDPAATDGLNEFSHIEVVFHFHQETRVRRGAAHPRGNPAWPPVGVLAGHSPVRPNHLGVSVCARTAHINGQIPAALATVSADLLASEPDIRPVDVLAVK